MAVLKSDGGGSGDRYRYNGKSYGFWEYEVSLSGSTLTFELTIKSFKSYGSHTLDVVYNGTTKTIKCTTSSSDTNKVTFTHSRSCRELTVKGNSKNQYDIQFVENDKNTYSELDIEWAAINTAPTVTLTVPTLMAGQSALLSWTTTDADKDTVTVDTLYRYYKASGASTFTSTKLSVSSSAKSYTDTIPASYAGGQVYYVLTVKDNYGGKGTATSVTQTITSNTAPENPGVPSFSNPEAGKALSVSWSAASDADGNLSGYILEVQLNGGSWTQVYKGSAQTYSYTVPDGTETIAFRVKAYDTDGAESSYATSATAEVSSGGISGALNINGVVYELTGEGYVNIGGVLCDIVDSSVNIGGTLNSMKG